MPKQNQHQFKTEPNKTGLEQSQPPPPVFRKPSVTYILLSNTIQILDQSSIWTLTVTCFFTSVCYFCVYCRCLPFSPFLNFVCSACLRMRTHQTNKFYSHHTPSHSVIFLNNTNSLLSPVRTCSIGYHLEVNSTKIFTYKVFGILV